MKFSDSENGARVSVICCDSYSEEAITEAVRSSLAAFGGMSHFVSAGQTVLVKPNLLSPRSPDLAVTTHPAVAKAVVKLCIESGAGRVWVSDSCAGNHSEKKLWEETGMLAAVSSAGGTMKSMNGEIVSYTGDDFSIPVPAWLDDVDVFVSVPKLKTHFLTSLTCVLKNSYGLIPGVAKALYHAKCPSPRTMSRFLVKVYDLLTPALSVVDAVVAMEGNGPSSGKPVQTGLIMAGTDGVAVDCCCAECFDLRGEQLPMVRAAYRYSGMDPDRSRPRYIGDGCLRLEETHLRPPRGRFLQALPELVFRPISLLMKYKPGIDHALCVNCGICVDACSKKAISVDQEERPVIDRRKCILCMCCMEACPHGAITVKSLFARLDFFGERNSKPALGRNT